VARDRALAPDEAALWARVMASVRPLRGLAVAPPAARPADPREGPPPASPVAPARAERAKVAPASAPGPGTTLDATWDRQLARGAVLPDSAIDLHGHSLQSAYRLLDEGLERALARGDRLLLLVTGKPPRPESERPHARGAIRAAVADWLAASRHADRIAAVRGAHPRHGGAGALYIVLRRPRPPRAG
jgi:DNA-nicking Smr family endonuclease